jgi:uncharacterized protein YjgD (DUF1641 family)
MSDDQTLKLLQSIDARLARLEAKAEEAPGMAMDGMAIIGDSIDEKFNPHTKSGLSNLDKVEKAQKILEHLGDQQTLDSIEVLVENLKNLTPLVSKLKLMEDGVSIFADSLDEIFSYAMAEGLEIEDFSNQLKKFSFLMIKAFESGAFTNLMDSGMLDPKTVETMGAVGKSMSVSHCTKCEVRPVQMISSLFDKDIQRALGFLLTFSKHFGRSLDSKKQKVIKA